MQSSVHASPLIKTRRSSSCAGPMAKETVRTLRVPCAAFAGRTEVFTYNIITLHTAHTLRKALPLIDGTIILLLATSTFDPLCLDRNRFSGLELWWTPLG